jgi:4-amino-4-deoxy-L-arabinose transferase-like glycosyltransferase
MSQLLDGIACSRARSVFFLLLLAGVSLFSGLGALPFLGADEPRYARIAQEMRASGEWVTPTLQARPWLEKPPLYYWISQPFLRLPLAAEIAARLGPALCGLVAALAIFWLGARLWGRPAGLLGGAIVLTSLGFAAFARGASTDMPMAACFTVAMALLAGHLPARQGRWRMTAASGVFLGLAVLAKGPVAVVLASAIVLLFWLLDEQGGSLRFSDAAAGLLACAAVSLPWFWLAFRENGFAFVSTFLINHNLARYVSDLHHHPAPFYYYFAVLPGLLFPWTGWLPALFASGAGTRLRRWSEWRRPTVYVACWILVPLLFFSLSRAKLPGYILPSLPPLALLLGRSIAELPQSAARRAQSAVAWVVLLTSAAVSAALIVLFQTNYAGSWSIGAGLALPMLGAAAWAFRAARCGRWGGAVHATLLGSLAAIVAVSYLAAPVLARRHSTRDIARRLLAERAPGEDVATYRFFHHTLEYYTNYAMTGNLRDAEALRRFAASRSSFLLVAEAARLHELRSLAGCSTLQLGEQGKLRLLRFNCASGAHRSDTRERREAP